MYKQGNNMPKCGNKDCRVSTFIDQETLTFGSGDLDANGLWELPCKICEEAYKEKTKIIDAASKVHASNILGLLDMVTGKLPDPSYKVAEGIIQEYIIRYFKDSENVSGKKDKS
jgi:hypothetical protein